MLVILYKKEVKGERERSLKFLKPGFSNHSKTLPPILHCWLWIFVFVNRHDTTAVKTKAVWTDRVKGDRQTDSRTKTKMHADKKAKKKSVDYSFTHKNKHTQSNTPQSFILNSHGHKCVMSLFHIHKHNQESQIPDHSHVSGLHWPNCWLSISQPQVCASPSSPPSSATFPHAHPLPLPHPERGCSWGWRERLRVQVRVRDKWRERGKNQWQITQERAGKWEKMKSEYEDTSRVEERAGRTTEKG